MRHHHRLLAGPAGLLLAFCLPAHAVEPDWSAYARLLSRHVSVGQLDGVNLNRVNYSALKDDPLWPQVLKTLESFPLEQLENRNETLSFHINAYNILAIKMVLDHWPVDSIKDAGSWFSPVWEKTAGQLGGKDVTLQQVEDEFLRALDEPRIHMAIVCASVSCPDLRDEPYRAASLEQQLNDQTRLFLANDAKGLQLQGEQVQVSKIFDWFEQDFKDGGVEGFIRRYRELPAQVSIKANIEYNWTLNGQ